MAVTRTFSIIKPDATRRNLTGAVTAKLEEAGLRVVASKRLHLSRAQAEGFYAVHAERPFFNDLVEFMISGPVVVQVLEGEDAVKRNRDVMGATNPANADAGTIRKCIWERTPRGYPYGQPTTNNPTGPSTGVYRVLRGGFWNGFANYARCASRVENDPTYSSDSWSLRCVRTR